MPEWLQSYVESDSTLPANVLAARLAVAFLLGCVSAGVHRYASGWRDRPAERSFQATLVLLAVLIAVVTLVIGNNVARAFSLVGALAIVRFRTVVEDTRDTAFVIYSVVVGMAAGTGYIMGALLCTPLVMLVAWLFRPTEHAAPVREEGTLMLRFALGHSLDASVEKILSQHLASYRVIALSTARGGSALDVTYSIRMPPAERAFALVTDLNRLEGIQAVDFKENK
ncbi:MAG: DUF4956 domain-containing protein [Gemmataceae bacterium]